MQNTTRVFVVIAFFATLAFIFFERSKQIPQQTGAPNTALEPLAKPVVSEIGKEAGVAAAKPGVTTRNTTPGATVMPPASLQDNSKDKIKFEQAELEKLRELNKTHVSRITLQMKTDEIASLKKSIINDQLIIKKIENDGSSIEYYKMMQSNLEIRKKRLQQLLKK